MPQALRIRAVLLDRPHPVMPPISSSMWLSESWMGPDLPREFGGTPYLKPKFENFKLFRFCSQTDMERSADLFLWAFFSKVSLFFPVDRREAPFSRHHGAGSLPVRRDVLRSFRSQANLPGSEPAPDRAGPGLRSANSEKVQLELLKKRLTAATSSGCRTAARRTVCCRLRLEQAGKAHAFLSPDTGEASFRQQRISMPPRQVTRICSFADPPPQCGAMNVPVVKS